MNDLISRAAICSECMIEKGGKGCWACLVQEAPAVDAFAPVIHGHWEPVKSYTGVECSGYKEEIVENLKCSVCGNEIDVSEGHFQYCPACGAKMDKVSK